MADHAIAHRVQVAIEHGLPESEALRLSRFARDLPFELHVCYGHRRIDARSIVEMLDLSHDLGEVAIIELEAEGDVSPEALDRVAEEVRHPVATTSDELAFFGLVGSSGGGAAACPSIAALDGVDCLHALSLVSGPLHPDRQRPDLRGPMLM